MANLEIPLFEVPPVFYSSLKMFELLGIGNDPYVHNVLLAYGHRYY